MKENLRTWLAFLSEYSWVTIWQQQLDLVNSIQIQTYAVGTTNFRVCYKRSWCGTWWAVT